MALDWKQMAIDQLEWYWQTSFRPPAAPDLIRRGKNSSELGIRSEHRA